MMKKMNFKDKISSYLMKMYKISDDAKFTPKIMSAEKLITPGRIDLIAKIQYLKAVLNKKQTRYYEDQYKATIDAFTDGSFKEQGNSSKNSFEKYKKLFIVTYENISKNGFNKENSVVPISSDGILLDGAHRVASCYCIGEDVITAEIEKVKISFDYRFFIKKGIDKKYLDNMVFEYAKMKDDVYVICLWPICGVKKQREVISILEEKFKVIYQKSVEFNYNGLKNFMSQVYYEQHWIGTLENGYKGVAAKLDKCYKENQPTQIIIVEEHDINKIVKEKEKIRKLVGIGNHSIHSTDDKEETVKMLSLVLNDNSISFLNVAKPYKYPDITRSLLEFKKGLIKDKIPIDNVIVDSGSCLALYGLRYSNDIDVLVDNAYEKRMKNKSVDSHNMDIKLYETTLDDMLYNPGNYFYYEGMKVIVPERLIIMKKNRANDKDGEDIKYLSSLLQKQSRLSVLKTTLSHKTNRCKYKMLGVIIPILQKLRIYNFLKRVLGVKGKNG